MFTRVLTLALSCLATAANAQTFLVNETFDDLERLNQNGPSSLRWTVGAHHDSSASAFGSLDASTGKLVLDHTLDSSGSYATALGYFTESGSPFTLGIGETLRLSFEVTFTNGTLPNSSNGFRWALFDSGGVRVTNDFAGTNESGVSQGSTFSGWRGYEALLPVAGTPTTGGDFLTRERNGSGNGLFTSANWNEVGTSSVAEPLFSTGTPTAASWN